MRRVWSLSANTTTSTSDAVYLVADVIPVFDERVLSFVSSCYHSDSALVGFVVKHGIDAGVNSALGRNVTFCSLRYGVSVHDLCSLPLPGSFSGTFFAGVWV